MSSQELPRILRRTRARRSGFKLPEEVCSHWTLLAAEEGRFWYEVAGMEAGEASFGEVILCPPGLMLRRRALTPEITFYFCEFSVPEGHSLAALLSLPREQASLQIRDTAHLSMVFARMRSLNELPTGNIEFRRFWADCLMTELICLALAAPEPARSPDPLMDTIARHLEQEANRPVSLRDVAHRFDITPVQLARRFTAAHGITPRDFLADARIRQVQQLLVQTDWTIERVALACGYRDGFYLSRVFRLRVGVTPSQYRRAHQV